LNRQTKHEEESRREAAKQAEADRIRETREQRGYQLLHDLPDIDRADAFGTNGRKLITARNGKMRFLNRHFQDHVREEAEQLVRQDLLAKRVTCAAYHRVKLLQRPCYRFNGVTRPCRFTTRKKPRLTDAPPLPLTAG